METIGKVLSIILLTFFGSAAATVYLVDSNKMPSFLMAPVSYTSDKQKPDNDSKFFYDTARRGGEGYDYSEAVVENEEPESPSDIKPIWGQTYDADPVSTYSGARKIAEGNSIDSLRKDMQYRKARYVSAVKSGSFRKADTAFRNCKEYKKALELKQAAE
jgi:hypothetical protein